MGGMVAVVGAGIGGLATAAALGGAGVEVTVLERAERLEPLGAGLSLWPNAVRALRDLGVADALQGREIPRGDGGLWRWDGTLLAPGDAEEVERRHGAPLILVHRAELQAALLAALAPGTVRLGRTVTGFEQDAQGARVRLDDGETLAADLLVAADGLHSTVRGVLRGDEPPRDSGLVAYRAVVPHAAPARVGEFWGPGGVFGVVPLSGERVYWYATRRAAEAPAAGDRDGLVEAFGAWAAPIPGLIAAAAPEDVLRHALLDRPPGDGWADGRVALLGDAAHPMLPFLGQGACQAIEDAVALAAAVSREGAVPGALETYAHAREARAAMLVKRSRAAGRVAHLGPAWQRALRDAVLRRTPARVRQRQLDAVIGR